MVLEQIVQVLVFRVMVAKFFPTSPPSKTDIEHITSRINSLWIASKECGTDGTEALSIKSDLDQEIQQVFRPENDDSRKNPLKTFLPAYKTLWHVVIWTFLEVRFRSASDD
jgi:hypothetical protein